METQTTITPNFQIHIPVAIRKKTGITTHGKARMYSDRKGRIIIEKMPEGFLSLAGTFQTKKPITVESLRENIDLSV